MKLEPDLNAYVVFLPSAEKTRVLRAIFGSHSAVDILKVALTQGVSEKIYQQALLTKLDYSNKTVIGTLKTLTKLGVLDEQAEKTRRRNRAVWVKSYTLSESGKWFALLLAEEKELSSNEKAQILQDLFRIYVRWIKNLSFRLHVDKRRLEETFRNEMQ